jgi:hypothetical protein
VDPTKKVSNVIELAGVQATATPLDSGIGPTPVELWRLLTILFGLKSALRQIFDLGQQKSFTLCCIITHLPEHFHHHAHHLHTLGDQIFFFLNVMKCIFRNTKKSQIFLNISFRQRQHSAFS